MVKGGDENEFEWEASKENVQLLKEGRNVGKLNKALIESKSRKALQVKKDRIQEFEDKIETYAGEDPLSVWIQYVTWLAAEYPTGSKQVFEVVERCTREFHDSETYRNDPRYISMWVRYADSVGNPKEIFNYLHKQRIGNRVALFYAAWSCVAENSGNFKKADQLYQLGIKMKAKPLELIQRKQRQFERRMNRRIREQMEEGVVETQTEPDKRKALGKLTKKHAKSTFRKSSKSQQGVLTQPQQPNGSNGQGFAIFQDPVEQPPAFAVFDDTKPVVAFPTQQQQRKENHQEPGIWTDKGGIVSSIPERVQSAAPFEIFEDEEMSFEERRAEAYRLNPPVYEAAPEEPQFDDDVTINTKVAIAAVSDMFASPSFRIQPLSPETGPPPPTPSLTEPIERQLHFSIFEDSINTPMQVKVPTAAEEASKRMPLAPVTQTKKLTNRDALLSIKEEERSESISTPKCSQYPPALTDTVYKPGYGAISPISTIFTVHLVNPFEIDHRQGIVQSRHVMDHLRTIPNVSFLPDQSFPLLKRNTQFDSFKTHDILGTGAFAKVYNVTVNGESYALKVEQPVMYLPYEFYIVHQVQERQTERSIVANPNSLRVYDTGALYLMEKSTGGTLHSLVNSYIQQGARMPEPLVLYYTLELLKAVHAIHSVEIIHGDIKPDNILLTEGSRRVALIDFGRAIDLKMYSRETQFVGNCHASGFSCIEMLTAQPWTYQIDSFGICACAYFMLFNSYMEVERHPISLKWTFKNTLKRYWNTRIWSCFFSELLNLPGSLAPMIQSFETALVSVNISSHLADQSRRFT